MSSSSENPIPSSETENGISEKPFLEVNAGDSFRGFKVTAVFAKRKNYIIFAHTRGFTHMGAGLDKSKIQEHMSELGRIMADISLWVPISKRHPFHSELGHALKCVFDECQNPPPVTVFSEVSRTVRNFARSRAREMYLLGALLGMIVIWGLIGCNALLSFSGSVLIWSGGGGSLGALLSVLIRASKVEIDIREPKRAHLVQGGVRIILGAIFGPIAMLAVEADLIFSVAKQNDALLQLIAFMAGFSERLVPELMNTLESSGQNKTD